jgi:predicted DNA-binding ribbon-helix-helix protein
MIGEAPDEGSGVHLNPTRPVKRSFSIAGHRTSISLEAAFWDAFRELCRADGVSMAAQLADLDRLRGSTAGLSGTVRVWVLQRYRAQHPDPAPIDQGADASNT